MFGGSGACCVARGISARPGAESGPSSESGVQRHWTAREVPALSGCRGPGTGACARPSRAPSPQPLSPQQAPPWRPVPQNPPSSCASHDLSSELWSHLPDLGPAGMLLSHPGADESQEAVCPPRGKHTLNFTMAPGGLQPPEAYL